MQPTMEREDQQVQKILQVANLMCFMLVLIYHRSIQF